MGEQNLVHTPLLHYILLIDIVDGQKRRVPPIGTPVSLDGFGFGQPLWSDTHGTVLEHCYLLRWQSRLPIAHYSAYSGVYREDSPRAEQLLFDMLFELI